MTKLRLGVIANNGVIEHFTCNTVEHNQRFCACGTDYVRPNQRDCRRCHALAQSVFREREKQRREAANRLALEAIAARASQH